MKITQLDPEMLVEIAMGVRPAAEVFVEYGYTPEDYMVVSTYPWFHRAVADSRARMESEGYTLKNKMTALAEDLLVDAWSSAKKSSHVEDKLNVAKYLSKLAGLEPQTGALGGGSGGFSVTINIPSPNGAQPTTITAVANIDAEDIVELPAAPVHVLGRSFLKNEDLSGLPV